MNPRFLPRFLPGFLAAALWLCACSGGGGPFAAPGPGPDKALKSFSPEFYLKRGGRQINISEANRQPEVLSLSDLAVFSDFSKSPYFEWDLAENQKAEDQKAVFYDLKDWKRRDLKEKNLKMTVFSSCSSADGNKEKIIRERAAGQYQTHFSILELLPESALLSQSEDPLSCAFIFTLNDRGGRPHQYTLTQQIIPVDLESKNLSLIKADGSRWREAFDDLETVDDLQQIFLLRETNEPFDSIRFICEGWSHQARFSPLDMGARPVFMNLLSARDQLPGGKKLCRILSENKAALNGATKPFYINFDNFKSQKAIDLSKINIGLIAGPSAFSGAKEFSPVHKEVYLSGAFRLSGLPEDLGSNLYEPVEVQVKTSCMGAGVEGGSFEETYSFPLTSEFSLMSVSPESLFQLDYPLSLWQERLAERQQVSRHWIKPREAESAAGRARKSSSSRCLYQAALKKPGQKEPAARLQKQIHSVNWDREGYGAEASKRRIKNQKYGDNYIRLLFASRFAADGAGYGGAYPDQMTLRCGGKLRRRREAGKKVPNPLILSWPFDERAAAADSVISYASIFGLPEVERYNRLWSKVIRCRLLFYQAGALKYFSPEIKLEH